MDAGQFDGPPREVCAFAGYEYLSAQFDYPGGTQRRQHVSRSSDTPIRYAKDCATKCRLDALCTAARYGGSSDCKLNSFTEGYADGMSVPQRSKQVSSLIVARPCDAVQLAGGDKGPAIQQWLQGARFADMLRGSARNPACVNTVADARAALASACVELCLACAWVHAACLSQERAAIECGCTQPQQRVLACVLKNYTSVQLQFVQQT